MRFSCLSHHLFKRFIFYIKMYDIGYERNGMNGLDMYGTVACFYSNFRTWFQYSVKFISLSHGEKHLGSTLDADPWLIGHLHL